MRAAVAAAAAVARDAAAIARMAARVRGVGWTGAGQTDAAVAGKAFLYGKTNEDFVSKCHFEKFQNSYTINVLPNNIHKLNRIIY